MTDISLVDRNFHLDTKIDKTDIVFYDALTPPFVVSGLFYENGRYRRMPEEVAKSVSSGVHYLHSNTAGGRVRFRTDSSYVAIHTKMSHIGKMPHFALCGSSGFDLYVDNNYHGSFQPPFDITDGYERVLDLPAGSHEILIHFPLYSDVNALYIGLQEGATIEAPAPYRLQKPVVYYGSSITQGGCASRPGNSYQGFISRRLCIDFVNLGFSGCAKGEKEISDYIKGLRMSAFVFDYDHNAPTEEHLAATHERMFLEVREANPTLPIILLSRPRRVLNETSKRRLEIIRATYERALAHGDKNVYLIEGPRLMELAGNEGTVDGCHPTDLGFFSMAAPVCELLARVLFEGEA